MLSEHRAMALHGGAGRGESLVISHRGCLDPIDIRNLERNAVALSIAKLWSEKREAEQLIASATLVRHLVRVNPPDAAASAAQTDALNQIATLASVRAQREDDATVRLPSGVLAGVIATSLVVALFPFAVGIKPVLPSIILASFQAALVVIGVVVVFQLDHAYSGPLAVQPDPVSALIQRMPSS